ncbi:hypothetical protein EDB19DRAFT_1923902 [Suillus lakei]|nr:hypothetical protein EDB19DRAFT_1923902 [Suillus lakei]
MTPDTSPRPLAPAPISLQAKPNRSNIIKYTCRDIQACNYKKVWAQLKLKIEHNGASEALQPIRNKDGVLCITTKDILEAIADHYDRLANTDPGPSQDPVHWANIDLGKEWPKLPNLNDNLTWTEVLLSIRRCHAPNVFGSENMVFYLYLHFPYHSLLTFSFVSLPFL